MKLASVIFSFFLASATAYTPEAPSTRREMFKSVFATGVAAAFISSPANAIDVCPPGTKNCIRTTWTPPSGISSEEKIASLRKVIESYPKEGQNGADLGGWTIAEDNFGSGSARYEYKSGIGNFAKFFNGGKPFVDDLKIEITDSAVEIRSSSRVGESDLGVNQKRLTYLTDQIRAAGWNAPDPKY